MSLIYLFYCIIGVLEYLGLTIYIFACCDRLCGSNLIVDELILPHASDKIRAKILGV